MNQIYAGTSGWAYTGWKPRFYPAKLPAAKFLSYYATRLNTVEVNYTFRHYASEKTLTNWVAQTPASFLFSVKAHQRITHIKRLADAAEETRGFLSSLQPLASAGRLGVVLFQLPPFLKRDQKVLADFLQGLPRGAKFAFEFRHGSWFVDETFRLLKESNVAICAAESEKLETPDVITADFCYYRLRKPEYTAEERQQISGKLQQHLSTGFEVFAYFKHEEMPDGALYAEELLSAARPR